MRARTGPFTPPPSLPSGKSSILLRLMIPVRPTLPVLSVLLSWPSGALAGAAQDASAPPAQGVAEEPAADLLVTVDELELSVEDAVRLALDNNLDYRLAEVQGEISQFDLLGSWGAFNWVFDASAGIVDSEFETGPNPQNPALPGGFVIDSEPQPTFSIDLTRPLTTGGTFIVHFDTVIGADATTTSVDSPELTSLTPGVTTDTLRLSYIQPLRRGAWQGYATAAQREAEIGYSRQLEVQRASRQTVLFNVHNAYWDLVSAIEQLAVGQSSLDLGLEQLEQNQRRLDAGVGTEVEVLQAQAEVASRQEAKLQLENTVEQAMDSLKVLLFGGREEQLWNTRLLPTSKLPEGELTTEWLDDWNQVLLTALEERSDLRQQRFEVDSARLRHSRTISERLSGLDLNLSATSRNVAVGDADAFFDTIGSEFVTLSATLDYNLPIGNVTADNAERSARAAIRAALLTYDQLEVAAVADVRGAVREVRYQAAAVDAAVQSYELAVRQLAAEQARYEADLSTLFQVLQFQQQLVEALSNERLARANFVKSRVALENSRGTLDEQVGP